MGNKQTSPGDISAYYKKGHGVSFLKTETASIDNKQTSSEYSSTYYKKGYRVSFQKPDKPHMLLHHRKGMAANTVFNAPIRKSNLWQRGGESTSSAVLVEDKLPMHNSVVIQKLDTVEESIMSPGNQPILEVHKMRTGLEVSEEDSGNSDDGDSIVSVAELEKHHEHLKSLRGCVPKNKERRLEKFIENMTHLIGKAKGGLPIDPKWKQNNHVSSSKPLPARKTLQFQHKACQSREAGAEAIRSARFLNIRNEFENHPDKDLERHGSQLDFASLNERFIGELGYEDFLEKITSSKDKCFTILKEKLGTEVTHDSIHSISWTIPQMKLLVVAIATTPYDGDAIIISFNTHGNSVGGKTVLYGNEGKTEFLSYFLQMLDDKHCHESLQGKSKIILVQACRGKNTLSSASSTNDKLQSVCESHDLAQPTAQGLHKIQTSYGGAKIKEQKTFPSISDDQQYAAYDEVASTGRQNTSAACPEYDFDGIKELDYAKALNFESKHKKFEGEVGSDQAASNGIGDKETGILLLGNTIALTETIYSDVNETTQGNDHAGQQFGNDLTEQSSWEKCPMVSLWGDFPDAADESNTDKDRNKIGPKTAVHFIRNGAASDDVNEDEVDSGSCSDSIGETPSPAYVYFTWNCANPESFHLPNNCIIVFATHLLFKSAREIGNHWDSGSVVTQAVVAHLKECIDEHGSNGIHLMNMLKDTIQHVKKEDSECPELVSNVSKLPILCKNNDCKDSK